MRPRGVDRPISLAGAHGRIDAYRYALDLARDALLTARPYITKKAALQEVDRAVKLLTAELAVTTRLPETNTSD